MNEGTLLPTRQKFKRILREYYEQSNVNKLDNLDKTDKFQEKQTIKIDISRNRILYKLVTRKETKLVIRKFHKKKSPGPGFTGEFYKTFKEELTPIIQKLLNTNKKKDHFQIHSMRPVSACYKRDEP